MFEHLRRVSLCGYCGGTFPNREKYDVLLNERRIVSLKIYNTYGDEYSSWKNLERERELEEWFANEPFEDAFAALNALLTKCDRMFRIPRGGRVGSPGIFTGRKPAEGWLFEF
jgi:hypothetical protein